MKDGDGMEEHLVKNKSQRDSQIKVITNWQHTEQPSPAFKRLMNLLLQKGKEREREGTDDGHKL